MKTILIAVLFLLSACTTVVEKPVQVPVEVKVPVREACVTEKPVAPVWETSLLKADDDVCKKVDALLIERKQREIYTQKLEAVLTGCEVKNL